MRFSSSGDSIQRRSMNLGQANFKIQPTHAALRRDNLVICAAALFDTCRRRYARNSADVGDLSNEGLQ
jgi:hypothetical protein